MAILTRHATAALLAAAIGAGFVPADAQTRVPAEDEIKAVFLYNFGKYVDWPAAAFPAGLGSPLKVCVVADEAFRRSVTRAIADETVGGHPMTMSVPATPLEARDCHILFVNRSDPDGTRTLLAALADTATLTVGEGPEFLDLGGAIAFVLDQGRVRFDVNRAAATRQGVTISAKLLRVARRVTPR